MEYRLTVVVLLCLGLSILPQSKPTKLRGLRELIVVGVAGRFPVDRDKLQQIISDYGHRDKVVLPAELQNAPYDETLFGELNVANVVLHETYFDGELHKNVTKNRRTLQIWAPVLIEGNPGLLQLGDVTDDPSPMTFPTQLNHEDTTVVDSIVDSTGPAGQSVTYKMADGSLIRMTLRYNATCIEDSAGKAVGEDADAVMGKTVRGIAPSGGFDWGCEDFASEHGYCKELQEYGQELEEAGDDVCIEFEISESRRCTAAMVRIDEVTGQFHELFPYLQNGTVSFENEFIEREAETSVLFPCY